MHTGYREQKVVCVSDDSERIVVSDKKCERLQIPKPTPRIQRCNLDCSLR